MTDKQFAFELDFAYDDVTQGLNALQHQGKSIMDVFLKMADQMSASMTKTGQTTKKAIDPLDALGKAVAQTMKGVTSSLETMERQVRQIDMSKLEKDADKYGEMIKKAQANLNQLYAESEKVNTSEEDRLKLLEKIVQTQGQINQMEQAQGKIQALAAQERAQQKMAEQQKQAAAQAKADAKQLADQQAESTRQAKADAKELADIERQITRESNARLKDMAKESKAQEKANAQALKVAALEAADALKKMEEAEKAAAREARELDQAQKQAAQSIIGLASEVRGPVVALAASLGVLVGSSFKQFMGLSDQMTTFKAVANATGDEIQYMVKEAKAIEGIPTEQAAKASVALARAGLSAKDAANALGIMGKAAIASGEDLESTSSLILATNRAFGLANGELEKTGDIMAKVANATNSSIGEIGHAMSIMGSSAKSNNQTLLSTATIFGLLRDQGLSAEMAATGYKNALNAMATPAKQTNEAMDALYKTTGAAKQVFTENGKMKDFGVILEDLKGKLEGFDDITQANILEKIFPDERSLNIVRSYFGITEEKIQSTTTEINKFAGELDRTAKVMEESAGHQFRALQKDFENFKSGLGEDAAPVLQMFVGLLRDLLKGYQDLSEPIKAVVANGVLIAAGVTSLIGVTSQLVITIGGAVFAWNEYTKAAGRAAASNVTMAKTSESATVGLNTALTKASLLSNVSFGVLTAGLTVVAAEIWAIVAAYDAWQKAEEDRRAFEADARLNPNEGALNAIKNTPYENITGEQANKAARDAQFQDRLLRSQLKDLQEIVNLGDMQKRGVAGIADREKQMALFHKLREAGLAMDDVNAEINRVRHQIDALRPQLGRANAVNELLNQGRPTILGPSATGTQNLENTADAKTNEFIRALDARFDKRLNDQILAAKQTANGVPVSNEGIMRSNLFAKELFPDTPADQLVDKTLEFFKSDSGLTRFLVEAIEKGLSPLQYNAYLQQGDANGYTPLHDKAFQLGITNKRETELTPANMQALQQYFGQIGYKQEGATNIESLASLFQMTLSEFQAFMDETVYPDRPLGWTPDELVDAIFKADFSQTDFNQPFNPNAKDGQQDTWAWFKEFFSNAMSETGNPGARFSTPNLQGQPGETQDQIEARLKVANIEERITALRAEQAKYTDVESKEYKNLNQEISRREAELSAAKGQSVDKDKAAEKERLENAKSAAKDLRQIYERNRDAQIAAMEEGAEKTEALRKKDLEDNQAELAQKLDGFKGDVSDRNKLIEGYLKQQALINNKYDEEQKENAHKHNLELRELNDQYTQNQINSMADGITKQTALIKFELKQQNDAYDDQLYGLMKNAEANKEQIARIEDLKTQAGIAASKRLKEAVIQDEIDKAQFRKEQVKRELDENQQAFDQALAQMIADKKKLGIAPGNIAGSLKRDEIFGLAGSLGQSSARGLVGNLQDQLKANKALQEAEQKRRDQAWDTGNQKAYTEGLNRLVDLEKERLLIQDKLNTLSEAGFIDWLEGYQQAQEKLAKINEEFMWMQTTIHGVSGMIQAFASQFGQAGQAISQGLGVATGMFNTIATIQNRMTNNAKKGESFLDTFFGNIENVKDVFGLVSTGLGMVGGAIARLIDQTRTNKDWYQKMVLDRVNYEINQELRLSREILEIRKQRGQATMQEEIVQIQRETEQTVRVLEQQKAYVYNQETGKWQDNTRNVKKTGLFGEMTAADQYFHNQGIDQQIREAQASGLNQMRQAEQAELKNQEDLTKAHYTRLADTRIAIAKNTKAKLTEIEAQYTKDTADLYQQLLDDQRRIINSSASEEDKQKQLASLLAAYQTALSGLGIDKEQAKRDAAFEKTAARLDAEAKHQNALNELKEDGFIKDREAMVNARDQEQDMMAAQRDRYKKYTTEWIYASQARADALIVANNRIKKSDEEVARQRSKSLADMRSQTALLNAGLTQTGVDDAIVNGQNTLSQSIQDEAEERRRSIANYGQDQELLTAIANKYAALRAKNEKDTQKAAFDAVRQDYEQAQQALLTNQLTPLQRILDAENQRVKALQQANVELEQSLKLIDERYQRERDVLNVADRSRFDILKNQPITLEELTAGANEIANENIKNGVITDRSSKETQLRGLGVLLAGQAQEAETKRKNEGYDTSDNNLNTIGFVDEMSGILGRQAAVIDAQVKMAKTAKERRDLEQQGADLYVKYQSLQMEKLAARQAMEKKGSEDKIQQNNEEIDSGWETVNQTQKQMDALQTVYDEKMKGVSNAFLAAGGSADILLEKLKAWAPELAASSAAALNYIYGIKSALDMPTGSSSDLYGPGFTADKPSVITPFFDDPWAGFTADKPSVITPWERSVPNPLKSFASNQMAMPGGPQMIDNSVHIGTIAKEVDADKLLGRLSGMGYGNEGVKTYGINAVSRH